jgi:hypothetical protein
VRGFDGPCCLDFDDDLVFDDQVGEILADNYVVVNYVDGLLLDDGQPLLFKLVGEGSLVNLLEKSAAKALLTVKAPPIICSVVLSDRRSIV